MTSRLLGLLFIGLLCGCNSGTTNSTHLSSLDSTKKYLNGVWCRRNQSKTSEYQFANDFKGIRISGTKENDKSVTNDSDPETFELLKEGGNVKIKITSMAGQTIATVSFLSNDKLIIDDTEYYKINYR